VSLSEGIEELRAKYVEILAMRLADSAATPGAGQLGSARERMSSLASRFPGALRELDDLEISEIHRRIAQLDAVLAGTGRAELWMEATLLFHRLARGALWAKRWLKGQRSVTAGLEAAYAAEAQTLDFADAALAWRSDLAAIARPPEGRVMGLVYARIGVALGLTETQARRVVFGSSRTKKKSDPAARGSDFRLKCGLDDVS
jgi:hypothetical protein